jgi:hypothetical protein
MAKRWSCPSSKRNLSLKLNFDTLATGLTKVEHSDGETKIYGSWSVRNLCCLTIRGFLSSDIVVPNGSIDANLFVGTNYVSLDSSSVIHLKKLTANPYVKYTLNPVKIYELEGKHRLVKRAGCFRLVPYRDV